MAEGDMGGAIGGLIGLGIGVAIAKKLTDDIKSTPKKKVNRCLRCGTPLSYHYGSCPKCDRVTSSKKLKPKDVLPKILQEGFGVDMDKETGVWN